MNLILALVLAAANPSPVASKAGGALTKADVRKKQAAVASIEARRVEGKATVQAGDMEILINETGTKMLDANLRWLGPIVYYAGGGDLACALQSASGVAPRGMEAAIGPLEGQERQGGSTDVGDVSWVTPTLHVSVATAPRGVPWHAWPVVAPGGMSIGHKGML